jgi:hypothetical protein
LNASERFGGFCDRDDCEGQLGVKTECLGDGKVGGGKSPSFYHGILPPTMEILVEQMARKLQKRLAMEQEKQQQTVRVVFDLNVKSVWRISIIFY